MAPIFTGVTRGTGGFGFGRLSGPSVPTVFGATGGNVDADTPGNGYTYHVFTGPGTLTLTGPPGPVEYLVVAGGASGGYDRNGGGGAGGLRCNSPGCPSPRRTPVLTLTTGGHTITVGEGGATRTSYWGNPGNDSSLGTQVVASGGGSSGPTPLLPGGSGFGGGSQAYHPYGVTVASPDGLTPTVQGFPGGNGPGAPPSPPTSQRASGGGGGAGGAGYGGGTAGESAGMGGSSLSISDFAGPLFPTLPPAWQSAVGPTGAYAGGGGGGGDQDLGGQSPGAVGGGAGAGNGGTGGGADGTAAVANTGSGGGGGSNIPQGDGGAGGDGIVIVRYSTP
jgi:hypothetical protein